jgi:hypothetical protein
MTAVTNRWPLAASLAGVVLAFGCGGQSSPTGSSPVALAPGGPSRQVAMVDSDGDGVPDDIEIEVGTDPHNIDTDGDGLTDHYELWGCQGYPVGQIGSLHNLPDPNHNGVIAALDKGDAGMYVLNAKQLSAIGTQRMPVPAYNATAGPTPTDLDGDLIPNDYELNGFYVEYDPSDNQAYFVKWDGKDLSKNYYKTDPLKWSTDGDPWSDYEEATKINLDQRIKSPGDNPMVPAYPDVHLVLTGYQYALNGSVTDSRGKTDTSSHSRSIASNWSSTWSVSGEAGWDDGFVDKVSGSYSETDGGSADYSAGQSNQVDWSSATTTDPSTAATLTFSALLVNLGTLPLTDPVLTVNMRINDFVFNTVTFSYKGELPAQGAPVPVAITNDGTDFAHTLYLTLNQVSSIEQGAPVSLDLAAFDGTTLISEPDADGQRVNVAVGQWSAYQDAIENNSAHLVVNVDDGSTPTVAANGLPERRLTDTRVFAFNPDDSYFGSPPIVTLRDALKWAANARYANGETLVTLHDPVTGGSHSASLVNWSYALDPDDAALVEQTPALQQDILGLPLRPSNPTERTYIASAYGLQPGDTQVTWARAFAPNHLLLASIANAHSNLQVTLLPHPGNGVELTVEPPDSLDSDEDQRGLYHLSLPAGYLWTGYEQLKIVDAAGNVTQVPVSLWRDELAVYEDNIPFAEDVNFAGNVDLDNQLGTDGYPDTVSASHLPDIHIDRPKTNKNVFDITALNGAKLSDVINSYFVDGGHTAQEYYRDRKLDYGNTSVHVDLSAVPFPLLMVETTDGRLVALNIRDTPFGQNSMQADWYSNSGL